MGVLIHDDFVDTTDTALASHIVSPTNIPNNSWVESTGSWKIADNRAVGITNPAFALIDAGVANCKISAEMKLYGSDTISRHPGILVRNAAYVIYADEANDVIRISTGNNTLASASVTLDKNEIVTLEVVVEDETIIATCKGVTAQYSQATINKTATTHGMRLYYISPLQYIEWFKIESLGEPSKTKPLYRVGRLNSPHQIGRMN